MVKNVVRVAGALALLYTARRYYRNWGTTKDECQMRLPGDELVRPPAVQSTEGVTINASASAVWPWLVQMGQGRGGLYTYETLENLVGLRSPNADRIYSEWQRLSPGDVVRLAPKGWMGLRDGLALSVEQVVEQEAIVACTAIRAVPLNGVWSIHLLPRGQDQSRLLIRTRARLRHPGEVLAVELAGPIIALMTRGMLLGIKQRAER